MSILSRLLKKSLIVAGIVIIVVLAIGFFKDRMLKSSVSVAITRLIGAPVSIEGFSFSFFRQEVSISGLKVYNPKGFTNGVLLDVPAVDIDYDLGDLLRKKIRLLYVGIELKQMLLERNTQGQLNVDALTIAKNDSGGTRHMPFEVDLLKLDIGKLVSKDSSRLKGPSVKAYELNIHKRYRNITSAHQLAGLILIEPMKAAGIKGAAIYGISALAGVGVLPVLVAVTVVGKDSVQQDFDNVRVEVFDTAARVIEDMGRVTRANRDKGSIAGNVASVSIIAKVTEISPQKTRVILSARKYLVPHPEIAGGIVYEMAEFLRGKK